MVIRLKPRFYKGEAENPYQKEEGDYAKSVFWYFEKQFADDPDGYEAFVKRGIDLIMRPPDFNYEGCTADDIPVSIRQFDAPLETRGFVANCYSNGMGMNYPLQVETNGFGLNWLSYFYEDEH